MGSEWLENRSICISYFRSTLQPLLGSCLLDTVSDGNTEMPFFCCIVSLEQSSWRTEPQMYMGTEHGGCIEWLHHPAIEALVTSGWSVAFISSPKGHGPLLRGLGNPVLSHQLTLCGNKDLHTKWSWLWKLELKVRSWGINHIDGWLILHFIFFNTSF